MNFQKAIFLSFVGHCLLLVPMGRLMWTHPIRKTEEPQINYYKLKEQITEVLKAARIPNAEVARPIPAAAKSAAKTDEKPAAEVNAGKAPPNSIKRPQRPRLHSPYLKRPEAAPARSEKIIPASIPGTTLPNTPQCVNYYQYIREEIRKSLKRSYTPEYSEGDVGVIFALNQAGELSNFDFDGDKSSGDDELKRIAYKSIKDASPFKPFPQGLAQKLISFNLTVVFKKD